MAAVYAAGLKNTRMAGVRDAMDAGTGAAKLEIGTANMAVVLVTITLDDPASTVSGAVLTLAGLPNVGVAVQSGTAAAARIRTSENADVVTGLTVGLSNANIILNSLSITASQNISVTAGTITHG